MGASRPDSWWEVLEHTMVDKESREVRDPRMRGRWDRVAQILPGGRRGQVLMQWSLGMADGPQERAAEGGTDLCPGKPMVSPSVTLPPRTVQLNPSRHSRLQGLPVGLLASLWGVPEGDRMGQMYLGW